MENKPDIISIIHREGFTPKQKGRVFWLSCPFHKDKIPSLKIDQDRQVFHCFSCNEHGDVISFIQRLHGLTFKDAVRYLNIGRTRHTLTNPKEKTKRDLVKAFHAWQSAYYQELCRMKHAYEALTQGLKTMEQAELVAWIFDELPLIEYRLDILLYGTDEQKYELYGEVKANGNEGI